MIRLSKFMLLVSVTVGSVASVNSMDESGDGKVDMTMRDTPDSTKTITIESVKEPKKSRALSILDVGNPNIGDIVGFQDEEDSESGKGDISIVDFIEGDDIGHTPSQSYKSEKTIYLTFDDGPMKGTENILSVLSEENVSATMFCVGMQVDRHRTLFEKERRMENIMIANHTYTHANGHYARFYSDLYGVMSDIEHAQLSIGGRKYLRLAGRNVWRTPRIRRDDRALSRYRRSVEIDKYDLLEKEGFFIFGWDVEWHFGSDGSPKSEADRIAQIVENIYKSGRSVRRGRVVLLAHDFMFRSQKSKRELRRFITIMKRRGWRFAKISDYGDIKPSPLYVAKYYRKNRKKVALATTAKPLVKQSGRKSPSRIQTRKKISGTTATAAKVVPRTRDIADTKKRAPIVTAQKSGYSKRTGNYTLMQLSMRANGIE